MAEPVTIRFLADPFNPVPSRLEPLLGEAGYRLQALMPGHPPGDLLLLFCPFWDGECFQSAETVWQKYLAQNHPETRLIVCSGNPGDDPNHIDLLNIPDDWRGVFNRALPAKRFDLETQFFSEGMDMMARLKRFLHGHGQESVSSICGDIYIKLVPSKGPLIRDESGRKIQEILETLDDEQTRKQWGILYARWANYRRFFQFLPFHTEFYNIETNLNTLKKQLDQIKTGAPAGKNFLLELISGIEALQRSLEQLEVYIPQDRPSTANS